jgi:diguanylate cyclase (GGDEF)-like protein
MSRLQKSLFASFSGSAAQHSSSRLGNFRRACGAVMATLGWSLACGLAAVALWLSLQWRAVDHAARVDTAVTIRPQVEGGDPSGIADPPETAMPASYRKPLQQHLFIANLLLVGLGLCGMVMAVRLDRRRRHAEEVCNVCLSAMDAAREGFLMVCPLHKEQARDMDFIVRHCNERGAGHAGLASQDLLDRRLSGLCDREGIADLVRACHHTMLVGLHEEEFETRRDGKCLWLQRRIVRSDAGLVITVRDISETRANYETLSKMANVDTLTGLPNRLWLMNFLPRAIDSAAASGSTLAVLFLDLDDFKSVNDTFGHDAGDALLIATAGRLAATIRAKDKLARLGGDEFVILLEQAEHAEIVQIARRIIAVMAENFMLEPYGSRQAHASIGISLYPQDGTSAASLLRNADQAMYLAKSGGKGRYVFHAASQAG